jgi:hypothetical protein
MSTLWTSLALLLAAAGIALAAWALFADRARSRKRCPKCWYEMTGVPSYDREGVAALVCPECGKPVKSERSLFKTRRRWKLAFLSPVLLVGAWLTWKIPEIRRDGWWSVAPRQVLIVLIPEIERAGAQRGRPARSPLCSQIEARVFRRGWELAGLTWPERWLLGSVCERLILSETTPEFTRSIAARGFVLTREDGIDRIPPERLAPVLLAQSNLTYRRATSYRDRGIVKGDIGERDERPFITAMTRQDQFRFEFLHGFGRELSHRYVIWQNGPRNGPQVKSWWTIRPQIATNPFRGVVTFKDKHSPRHRHGRFRQCGLHCSAHALRRNRSLRTHIHYQCETPRSRTHRRSRVLSHFGQRLRRRQG